MSQSYHSVAGIFRPKAGNIKFNTSEVVRLIRQALSSTLSSKVEGSATLHVMFAELTLTGYDAGDLYKIALKQGTKYNKKIADCLDLIRTETSQILVSVGFPYINSEGKMLILHATFFDQNLISIKGKEDLANNNGSGRGVEYETRYFVPCTSGMKINLFDKTMIYNNDDIFSNQPHVINGIRIATIICEEMFTGVDLLPKIKSNLKLMIDRFIKKHLVAVLPNYKMSVNVYAQLEEIITNSIANNTFIQKSMHPFYDALLLSLHIHFPHFLSEYVTYKAQLYEPYKVDIIENSKLYHILKVADLIIIPNGSPSACNKLITRETILRTILEKFRDDFPNSTSKEIYYINTYGNPGGSIIFDGSVILASLKANIVEVIYLSENRAGLIDLMNRQSFLSKYLTLDGQKEIIDHANGTKYWSGKTEERIAFAKDVADIIPKIIHECMFALDVSSKRIQEGFSCQFISQSGGFDSSHTLIIRSLAYHIIFRAFNKHNKNTAMDNMIKMFNLDRPQSFNSTFFNRFFLTEINLDVENPSNLMLRYHNLEQIYRIITKKSSIINDRHEAIILAKNLSSYLSGITKVSDLLTLLIQSNRSKLNEEEMIEFLCKIIVFHQIKTAYIRTQNSSIETERAAKLIATSLGADFIVESIDCDYKTALLIEKGIPLKNFNSYQRKMIFEVYDKIMKIPKKSSNRSVNDKNASLLASLKIELFSLVKIHLKNQNQDKFTVHNWFESSQGLEIENIQARTRAIKNWEIAYRYNAIPTSNPNTDESKMGYTTMCGDLHAGDNSSTADMRKTQILAELSYLMKEGLRDDTRFIGSISPVTGIYWTFNQPPSAELQQLADDDKIQQTDEDSYEMSYPELSIIGDMLFAVTDNDGHFLSLVEVHNALIKRSIFHGHSIWSTFIKVSKVFRQWHFNSFKRRSAPFQLSNSDVSVDHHLNNRIEFGSFERSVIHQRCELLLDILIEQGILQKVFDFSLINEGQLHENLTFNTKLQNKLQKVLWFDNINDISGEDVVDFNALLKNHLHEPFILNNKILERLHKVGLCQDDLIIIDPPITNISTNKEKIVGRPIVTMARDFAGNLEKVKKVILESINAQVLVIPDICGIDLGDSLRRVKTDTIDHMLKRIAQYAHKVNPNLVVIVGHPTYHPSKDRSFRYNQSATIIKGKFMINHFNANKIDNNNDFIGACYDTRTFQPHHGMDFPFKVDNQLYRVVIGHSTFDHIPSNVKIIHLGAFEAADQLSIVANMQTQSKELAISVNCFGSSSGIRAFNGRVIRDYNELSTFKEIDVKPSTQLELDAIWANAYLPLYGKVTISLDSVEGLYSLTVLREVVKKRSSVYSKEEFIKRVDVTCAHFKSEDELMQKIFQAAEEILGFPLNTEGNIYEIDAFKNTFIVNSLIGDVNEHMMSYFKANDESDSYFKAIDTLTEFVESNSIANDNLILNVNTYLSQSNVFRQSVHETIRRDQLATVSDEFFEAYYKIYIENICQKIRLYRPHPETTDRLRSIFEWLISARRGGEGQILLTNISRADLCCSPTNLFGGRMHAGGLTVTASHSIKAMKHMINSSSDLVNSLFEQKNNTLIADGITYGEVDNIWELLRNNNLDLTSVPKTLLPNKILLQKFANLWRLNIFNRHGIVCAPHSFYSVDQQTTFKEPLDAYEKDNWMFEQIEEIK